MKTEKRKVEDLNLEEVKLLVDNGYLEKSDNKHYKFRKYVGNLLINGAFSEEEEAFILSRLKDWYLEYALSDVNYDNEAKVAKLDSILEHSPDFAQMCYIHIAYSAKSSKIRKCFLDKVRPEAINRNNVERIHWLLAKGIDCIDKFSDILKYLKDNQKTDVIAKINQDIWVSILRYAKDNKFSKMEKILDELLNARHMDDRGLRNISSLVSDGSFYYSRALLDKIILNNTELLFNLKNILPISVKNFTDLDISIQEQCLSDSDTFRRVSNNFGLDSFKKILEGTSEKKITAGVLWDLVGYVHDNHKKFKKEELPEFFEYVCDKAADAGIHWTYYCRRLDCVNDAPKSVLLKLKVKVLNAIEVGGPVSYDAVDFFNSHPKFFHKAKVVNIINKNGIDENDSELTIEDVERFYQTYGFSADKLPLAMKDKILYSQKAKALFASVV